MLRHAFSAEAAAAVRELVWARMLEKSGIVRDDPSTWPETYDIEERLHSEVLERCFSDRLSAAVRDLLGDAWCGDRAWGFWPVNFSYGATRSYAFPLDGWHVDGNWFTHRLESPEQGLLVVGLFSDLGPRGGGTLLALRSHVRTAHALARHPEGLSHRELFEEVLREPLGDFVEVIGSAGDVALVHPFLFHNRGFNHSGQPRFISNTEAGLNEPMNLRASGGRRSVLEESVIEALQSEPPRYSPSLRCRF